MNPELEQLRELESLIADRLYIQIEKWNLYLGNAGLAEALAVECQVNLKDGPTLAARKALEAVQVQLASFQEFLGPLSLLQQLLLHYPLISPLHP